MANTSALNDKPAVVAAVADTPPMDPLDLPALMVNPAVMVNLANLAVTDNPDKEVAADLLQTGASTAHPDPLDQLEIPAVPDNLADLDKLALLRKEVAKDHPDPLVPPDQVVSLEIQEALVSPEDLDKSTKFPAQKDHLDPPVSPDNLEMMGNQEMQETQAVPDKPDLLEMLAVPDNLADLEIPEAMVPMETPADTDLATTAHPHVPLPDIKPYIQLSTIQAFNNQLRQTIFLAFLFQFCNHRQKI